MYLFAVCGWYSRVHGEWCCSFCKQVAASGGCCCCCYCQHNFMLLSRGLLPNQLHPYECIPRAIAVLSIASIDSTSKHQECVLQVKSQKNSLAGTSFFFSLFRCFVLNSEIRAFSQVEPRAVALACPCLSCTATTHPVSVSQGYQHAYF